ncbi:hypothetical protein HMI55_006234 [Coelomomyces lativittatus]|nr:hypothetical protein HMI55_006234 [Coelomomyces lativittatus]
MQGFWDPSSTRVYYIKNELECKIEDILTHRRIRKYINTNHFEKSYKLKIILQPHSSYLDNNDINVKKPPKPIQQPKKTNEQTEILLNINPSSHKKAYTSKKGCEASMRIRKLKNKGIIRSVNVKEKIIVKKSTDFSRYEAKLVLEPLVPRLEKKRNFIETIKEEEEEDEENQSAIKRKVHHKFQKKELSSLTKKKMDPHEKENSELHRKTMADGYMYQNAMKTPQINIHQVELGTIREEADEEKEKKKAKEYKSTECLTHLENETKINEAIDEQENGTLEIQFISPKVLPDLNRSLEKLKLNEISLLEYKHETSGNKLLHDNKLGSSNEMKWILVNKEDLEDPLTCQSFEDEAHRRAMFKEGTTQDSKCIISSSSLPTLEPSPAMQIQSITPSLQNPTTFDDRASVSSSKKTSKTSLLSRVSRKIKNLFW